MIYKSHFTFLLLITFFEWEKEIFLYKIFYYFFLLPHSYDINSAYLQWHIVDNGGDRWGHFCTLNINLLPFDRIVHKKRINVAHKSWYLHKIFFFPNAMEHKSKKESIRSQFVSLFLLFTTSQLLDCCAF